MLITMRDAAKGYHRARLTWRPLLITGEPGGTRTSATFVCGNGHFGSLDGHEIGPDGAVTPSVECPEPGCGWHQDIRLNGWPP